MDLNITKEIVSTLTFPNTNWMFVTVINTRIMFVKSNMHLSKSLILGNNNDYISCWPTSTFLYEKSCSFEIFYPIKDHFCLHCT